MPAQRVLPISILSILTVLVSGCGAQPKSASKVDSAQSDSAAVEPAPPEERSADDSPGQQIAELPSDVREVGTPDITIPQLPPKKKPDGSREHDSKPHDEVAEAPGSIVEHSAGDVVEQTAESDPYSDDVLSMNEDNGGSAVAPPPPPAPQPAGAVPTVPDRNTSAGSQQSVAKSTTVIQRAGATKEHKGFSSELVYFATNREPSTAPEASTDPDLFFSDERGDVSYGACEVSIPYKRPPGSLPEPSVLSLEFSQDPQKHVVLMEIERMPDAEFWKQLRQKVEASPNRQLMMFVHGYCATFRDAARRTAQMAYDMNYNGPSMFFSWPAGSDLEGFQERANYLKDLRRAEESDEDLITVIGNISRLSGAERVHLVAHSMGNFILTEALKTIDDRRGGKGKLPLIFDQVVMAAPDLDAKDFVKTSGPRVRGFSRRFTVYASKQDLALKLSKTVNGFEPLGLLNDHSRRGAESKLYELVDASTAESGWFDSGHVYYGDMPEMLIDLAFVFRGIPAASLQRRLGETPPLFRLTSRSR